MKKEITVKFCLDDECQQLLERFLLLKPFGEDEENYVLGLLAPDYISGLSLLGGEPFEAENRCGLLPLLRKAKRLYPAKDVWCYSGYTFEDDILGVMLKQPGTEEFLSYIDVLVDGEFVLEKKNISLRFRGSENQRIIDVKRSLENGRTILMIF